MSECVCLQYLSIFKKKILCFLVWLIIHFPLVSRCFLFALKMSTILFLLLLLLFVSFCCMHLHCMFIAVSNRCEICQMFFH